jgi:hypothetical protein
MNELQSHQMSHKLVSIFVIVLILTVVPVRAIEWCHDYVFYIISKQKDPNGIGKDSNGIQGPALRDELHARGYDVFKILTPGTPNESRFLKKGDVVIFFGLTPKGEVVDSHSGVVVDDQGHIDHFLQKFGTTRRTAENPNPRAITYTPLEAESKYDEVLKTTLVRRGWTLQQIRTFTYNIPSKGLTQSGPGAFSGAKIEVWRPTVDLVVNVLEADTDKRVADAEVRVRSNFDGSEIMAVVTDANGTTGKIAVPGDKIAQGLQVRVKSKDHKEKWSDVTRDRLRWSEELNFPVILDPKIDDRIYNTWQSPYFSDTSVVFRRDGTATYKSKNVNFSNTFKVLTNEELKFSEPGIWIELWHPDRSFRFLFRVRDGKVEFRPPIG